MKQKQTSEDLLKKHGKIKDAHLLILVSRLKRALEILAANNTKKNAK